MGEAKKMTTLVAENVRLLIQQVNEIGIKKESIVSLLKDNEQFYLIYYK